MEGPVAAAATIFILLPTIMASDEIVIETEDVADTFTEVPRTCPCIHASGARWLRC